MITSIKNWLLAFRPKTLTAAVAPVMIATAMAYGDGIHHFPTAFICLLTALTIQIGTNLANDYFDFKKGADTEERVGPKRVTQSGLIKPEHVLIGMTISFAISAGMCIWLMKRGGTPIAILGVLSILSGIFYTAGPRPLGYIGLGDIFVLIFFGPVAVGGTYFVQSFEINYAVILAGLAPGFISTAIIVVNNLRDMDSDCKVGKNTLAVRFGRTFSQFEYMFTIACGCLLPIVIYLLIHDHSLILLSCFTLFPAFFIMHTVCVATEGEKLNQALANTGKLLLLYSILFSLGWVL